MLRIFQPPSPNQITGGYLYNRRICAELGAAAPVTVDAERLPAALANGADSESYLLLDALYIRDLAEFEWLRRYGAIALVHGLASVDPSAPSARRASLDQRQRAFLGAVGGAVVTSHYMRDALAMRGFEKARIAACPPGVDAAYFEIEPRPASPPELITVANLGAHKGHLDLVAALAEVSRRRTFHWHIVGDASAEPDYAEAVAKALRATGLAEQVSWHGVLPPDEIIPLLARTTAHVSATRFESYGMAVAESLAAGLPVVAPRVGALPHLVTHGVTGLLTPPGDAGALANALARLLGEPELRDALAAGARTRRLELPSWLRAAREFSIALARL